MQKHISFVLLTCVSVFLLHCSSETTGDYDDVTEDPDVQEEEAECDGDEDCDDGFDCTIDSCGVGGVCNHTPIDSACPDGQECDPELGCIDPGCGSDGECSDDIDCTVDICGAGGECTNTPDDNLCPEDQVCSITTGCMEMCSVDADCDNGNFCDGKEECLPEFGCVPADEPRDCDDGEDCTEDYCDTDADECVNKCTPSAECECPCDVATAFDGCFSIAPPVAQTCGLGHVVYNISQVCFTIMGPILTVTIGPTFHDPSRDLTQTPAPTEACEFEATRTISGDCNEHYTISGAFSDVDNFEGQVQVAFEGGYSCTLGGCSDQFQYVTGTRIP